MDCIAFVFDCFMSDKIESKYRTEYPSNDYLLSTSSLCVTEMEISEDNSIDINHKKKNCRREILGIFT